MSTINKYIVIFVHIKSLDIVTEHIFKKNEDKYEYVGFNRLSSSMQKNNFPLNHFNSSKLNFCCKNGNKQKPSNYIEWYFTEDKNIYEINCGLIFTAGTLLNDTIYKKISFYKF